MSARLQAPLAGDPGGGNSRRTGLAFWILVGALLAASPRWLRGEGTVYLVMGSDTAVWNVSNGVNLTTYHAHYPPEAFRVPLDNASQVMDPAFRGRFTDSHGQQLKMTWWLMAGNIYRHADNTDVPVPNLLPFYLMRQSHGEAIRQLGDEVSLHYHTFLWSDYDGDGKPYWNQARSFAECREDFNFTLAECLLEEEVFPVAFRSGWHYLDNAWQAHLDTLLPYSLHNNAPTRSVDTKEPVDNVQDWSRAPLSYVPYHPSPSDYQTPGASPGWIVRSLKMQSVTSTNFEELFAQAATGTDQVVCFWAHLGESDFVTNLARLDGLAHAAASNHPTASFRYCTAVEAMRRWQGGTDLTPPQLEVTEAEEGEAVTLTLRVNEPIFQPRPFVAVKDVSGQYQLAPCEPAGPLAWTVLLPKPRPQLAKVGLAVTDLSGNLTTRLLRYLPDDLYLDNQGPSYAELEGAWLSTTNAAWGLDARVALLGDQSTARVRWTLPVSVSGPYTILVQAPAVSNAAGNLSYQVYAGGTSVATVFLAQPLPGHHWVQLATAFLARDQENFLEMTVSGGNQAGTFAVADVVRLSPLNLPPPGFIREVLVEAGDTTANVTWRTPTPATGAVEFGTTPAYGHFSPTNELPGTGHVMTLTGLAPGTTYLFQVNSTAGELTHTYQGSLTTSNYATTLVLFGLTNVWKYAARNLDHDPDWKTRAYDDSPWPSGPGLLWVDTRPTGPNPAVGARNTPMPSDPATNFPFLTYYFRTHFQLPGSPVRASLLFSNYLDDGAVFYLNGVEVQRLNLPASPALITNATLANAYSCDGDATCPALFTLAGNPLTNLVAGDNVLAVEVHNYSRRSPDITFGSALIASLTTNPPPRLQIVRAGPAAILYWNGTGLRLQEASELGRPTTLWSDVPAPASTSPCTLPNAVLSGRARFYRLRVE